MTRIAGLLCLAATAACTPAAYVNQVATPHQIGDRTWDIKVLSEPPHCRVWAEGGSTRLTDFDTFKYRQQAEEAALLEAVRQCCPNPVVLDIEQYQTGFANFQILMRCPTPPKTATP